MFYELQPQIQRENYKKMLSIVGSLTQLFSESDCPYLAYRAHENIFCKYFEAENLARLDCSADAKKNRIGIGLKTWTGQDDQKVAEFGKLRETFAGLAGLELVKKIAEYRNERIRVTKNLNGIDDMIYHVIKRVPGAMQVLECAFDYIDIENISLITNRGNVNNTYFTDGRHTYHFSTSKNTLYMIFEDMELLDNFNVEIMDDPYTCLMNLMPGVSAETVAEQVIPQPVVPKENQVCLRLYSTKSDGTKFVAEKSGLNQWNAGGRKRHPDEVYIPYPAEDRERTRGFFPDRDTVFDLRMPDGTVIPAKVCQQDNKAIMSNPNKILGEWLLRNVFELPERTLVTYEMLERFGIDSVIFTKHGDLDYSVDFAEIGTYEQFHGIDEEETE
ncbi:MAG: NgoFVII family restriction endonuclease [Clostridia bacterium]|nr:NgoFVII family restriction endonuclease [Clostridia bacterium]